MIEKLGVKVDDWHFFLLGGLLLLIALIFTEVARKDNNQRALRIIAIFFAVASLILLALKPFYLKESDGDLTIVFTEGSTGQDSLKLAHPNANFIQWSDTVQSKHLSANIIIDGFGIPQYDLWKVEGANVQYINSQWPSGIIDINYPKQVEVGEEVAVELKLIDSDGHKFVLQGLGEQFDSVIVSNNQQLVKLTGKLKAVGMYVLTIQQFDAGKELVNVESIPVIVNPAKKFDILLINAFPTFESRFLKQFLETSGHNYFIRNQISTDKYRYESKGTTISELPRLTVANLKLFDVVIINAAQLAILSGNQQRALSNVIQNEGLGLLVVAANGDLVKKLPDWAAVNFKTIKNESFVLPFENEELEVSTSAYRFINKALSETVYTDDQGNVAQSIPHGLGKLTTSAFTNTYELALSGYEKAYQNLWKSLIESCLKPQGKQWSLEDRIYYQHQPMEFEVNSDTLSRINYEGTQLAMKQNMLVNDRWESQLWPDHAGWNYMDINEPDVNRVWFYVHEEAAFKSLNVTERITANIRLINNGQDEIGDANEKKVEISLWWFYITFAISMAYLWIQPKLR